LHPVFVGNQVTNKASFPALHLLPTSLYSVKKKIKKDLSSVIIFFSTFEILGFFKYFFQTNELAKIYAKLWRINNVMVLKRPPVKQLCNLVHLNINENGNFPSPQASNFNCSVLFI